MDILTQLDCSLHWHMTSVLWTKTSEIFVWVKLNLGCQYRQVWMQFVWKRSLSSTIRRWRWQVSLSPRSKDCKWVLLMSCRRGINWSRERYKWARYMPSMRIVGRLWRALSFSWIEMFLMSCIMEVLIRDLKM